MKIGVFDSGIGGITVLKELIVKRPNNEYIYVGDTLNVPYGNKSKEELLKYSKKIINYLISKNVDMIIIACGTVSSNIGDILKKQYHIPIIDIIYPTINHLLNSNYNNIGILATHMTINSHIFSNHLNHKKVFELECPKLVPAIENNDIQEINSALNTYLNYFKNKKIDILILGCTHYPIVKDNIKNIIKNDITIFNMADPIIDMIEDNKSINKNYVEINMSYLNSDIISNINRILNDIEYNINLIKLN